MQDEKKSRQELIKELTTLRQQMFRQNAKHLKGIAQMFPQNEALFRTLAETTAAAIFIYQDTRIRYVNPAAETITGYSQEELLGLDFWDIFHPDAREYIKEQGLARQQGLVTSKRYELELLTKNGQLRWIDVTLGLIEFEGNAAVLGTAFDITIRKEAEKEQERLLAAERQQRLLAETLEDIFLILSAQTSSQAVLGEILCQAYRLVPHTAANITLLQENTLRIARWWGYQTYGAGDAIANLAQKLEDFPLDAQAVQSRQPLVVPNTQQNPEWVAIPSLEWIKSSISVPICLRNQVLGLLRLDSETADMFSPTDARFLHPLANAAAIALENARLYEQAQQELVERKQAEQEASELNQKLLTLQFASATLATNLDLNYVLETLTREITNFLEVEGCYISQWNRKTDTILVIANYGTRNWWGEGKPKAEYRMADYPLTRQVLLEGYAQQMTISQPGVDPAERDFMQHFQLKTLLMLPMEFQERIVGLVEVVDSREERIFTPQDIALTQLLANQAAIAMENARLYKQAQQEIEERLQVENELRRNSARTQSILDAIPDSMFYLSRQGELLDYKANDNLREILDAAIGGQHLNDIFPSETVDTFLQYIGQTLDTKLMQVFEYDVSTLLGKQVFEVRLVTAGPDEVLALVRNITQRKQAQQQAIRTERLAALGHLAAALAHELNNPLQAMQSHLDLILKYPLKETEKEEYLHIINKQIERLHNITRRVLNLAHPRSIPQQPASVIELLRQVVALTQKRLEQNHIRLSMQLQDNIPPVLAVADQLTQIFLNLIVNAIEAMPDSGQLNISVYCEGKDVAISFTNTGPAIPRDVLPHIFEPFFTTKAEGSGMGLWISHQLAQQHAGMLIAENLTEDWGVIFTIKLPAV